MTRLLNILVLRTRFHNLNTSRPLNQVGLFWIFKFKLTPGLSHYLSYYQRLQNHYLSRIRGYTIYKVIHMV